MHDIVTGDEIAEEVVRSLVGAVGLVASVPVTTAIAVYVVSGRIGSGRIGGGEHAG